MANRILDTHQKVQLWNAEFPHNPMKLGDKVSDRAPGGPSRYNVKKHQLDGYTFDSLRELKRYQYLKIIQRQGEISGLELQPRIPIVIGGVSVVYPGGRQMVYVGDFRYLREEQLVVEDVKMQSGHLPEVYKIKRALILAMGIAIQEV